MFSFRYSDKSDKDKIEIRDFWDKTFHDTKGFTDYYLSNMFYDNKILLAEEDEKVVGMIHLNPYEFMLRGKQCTIYYIVGVAIVPEFRLKGYMKKLLNHALNDIRKESPFTYLWPADTAYYSSSGFVSVQNCICTEIEVESDINFCGDNGINLAVMSEEKITDYFISEIDRLLDNEFDVYACRSRKYFERLIREALSEGCSMYAVYDNDMPVGYFTVGTAEGIIEVQHVVLFGKYNLIIKEILSICRKKYPGFLKIRFHMSEEINKKITEEVPLFKDNSSLEHVMMLLDFSDKSNNLKNSRILFDEIV